MLDIVLEDISKRYGYQTILSKVDLKIAHADRIGISGRNGSGKSTLLKIISSYLSPSLGKIKYIKDGVNAKSKDIAQNIGFSAPYVKVTQEMSLDEVFNFQAKFKPFYNDIGYKPFLELIELENPKNKEIRMFSSGMQQKVNLGLTILAESDVLLLDEPTSYLDDEAKDWFHNILDLYSQNRTVIIASNDKSDFKLIEKKYNIIEGFLV